MSPNIPLVMLGVDYTQASTRVRAAMVLSEQEQDSMHQALQREGMHGLVQISTCNRTVWLTVAPNPEWAGQLLEAQAQDRCGDRMESGNARVALTLHRGLEAVQELMRITTGLRSFVIGERQVSGQVHRAFEAARKAGHSHPLLNMLDTALGRAARQVQRLDGVSVDADGLHTVVEERLQQELGPPAGRAIRVLGTGEIGRAIYGRLAHCGWQPKLANRTPDPAGQWDLLDDVRGSEDSVCAWVVATGARRPVWTFSDLPPAVRAGKQSCLVIDVGSPAQVDVNLGDQPGVQRIGLDELLTGARTPLSQERRDQMEQVVLEGTDRYQRALVRQSWRGVWKTYQQQTDALTRQSLPSCLERHGFAEGSPQRVALEDELRRMITRYGHGLLDAMAQGVPTEQEAERNPKGGSK